MLKKVSKIMFIAMLVFSLVGSFTTTFAGGPPEDKANQNQACQNASDNGKSHANGNSVLVDCEISGGILPPPDDDDSGVDLDRCKTDHVYFSDNRVACIAAGA